MCLLGRACVRAYVRVRDGCTSMCFCVYVSDIIVGDTGFIPRVCAYVRACVRACVRVCLRAVCVWDMGVHQYVYHVCMFTCLSKLEIK